MGRMGLEALGLDAAAQRVYEAMLRYPDWGVTALARHLQLPETVARPCSPARAARTITGASRA
jgi:hypothetical protein